MKFPVLAKYGQTEPNASPQETGSLIGAETAAGDTDSDAPVTALRAQTGLFRGLAMADQIQRPVLKVGGGEGGNLPFPNFIIYYQLDKIGRNFVLSQILYHFIHNADSPLSSRSECDDDAVFWGGERTEGFEVIAATENCSLNF